MQMWDLLQGWFGLLQPDPPAALFLEEGVTTGRFMGDPGGGQVLGGALGPLGMGEILPVLPGAPLPPDFRKPV